jgi:hypothetical protein
MFMDMEAFEQGDRSGEHLKAYRLEQVEQREDQGTGKAADN